MNHYDSTQDAPVFTDSLSTLEAPNETPNPPKTRKKARTSQASGSARGTKNFVLDTNVLLHDPSCLGRFQDNRVFIPVDVLSELDKFKNEPSERGANARAVHRTLTKCFANSHAAVLEGVELEGGGRIQLSVEDLGKSTPALDRFKRTFPDMDRMDHRILASAVLLSERKDGLTILVTKDLNMHLKALAVGLECEDYLNDKVEARDVESYELRTIDVHAHDLQRFSSSHVLEFGGTRGAALSLNEYVLLRDSNGKTMPGRFHADKKLHRLQIPEALHMPRGVALRPVNLGQQCFIDALLDPSISLVTCYGQAGTGKTLVAVAAGLHSVFTKQFNGMTVSRPVVAMGETLGFLPGTLDEKMKPWLQPIYDALEVLMPSVNLQAQNPGSEHKHGKKKKEAQQQRQHLPQAPGSAIRKPYEVLMDQGIVEIEALCYIRGRSIPRRFFILDEAQQLTPLEAKTVVTRMSRGAKLVLVGDPAQIDNPYVDSRSNGLVYTRNRLKGEAIAAHVSLSKGERSPLAEAGARLM